MKFENPLGVLRDNVNSIVNETHLPNVNYESTVGVYGGKLKQQDDKMIFDMHGNISRFDQWGDAILRNYDEHLVKEPWKLIKRYPFSFFKFIMPGPKRFRGNQLEISKNAERLGLEEFYGLNPDGIEIKHPEIYTHGFNLQDVYRADLIANDELQSIDRFRALSEASKYVKTLHEKSGIGELLVSDLIFQKNEDGKLSSPVLNLPDIIYNEEKEIGEKEKKATDLLDFIISVGTEEMRRSNGDLESVKKAMLTVLENYGEVSVISLVKSYIHRGRLTLIGDADAEIVQIPQNTFTTKRRGIFTKHNEARLQERDSAHEAQIKNVAVLACEEALATLKIS